MQINGFQKTTLLDYPGHLACTIFLGSCNYRCPFCHNASLVLHPDQAPDISESTIFETLNTRKNVLEGVCITGGEPTLYQDLPEFISKIKALGYDVKLDTNGSNPKMLKALLQKKLIDYVAMDIKNSKEKYALTAGVNSVDIDSISTSISLLLNGTIPYEFRTTIVSNYHTVNDLTSIGEWIKGAENYYLQSFKDSGDIIQSGLNALHKEEIKELLAAVRPYVKNVSIRGVEL